MSITVPYIVLIGDVGHGKSRLFEKMTGVNGRQSDDDFSSTKLSTPFFTANGRLRVCDTPGTNPICEKLDHNMEIAYALNTYPVSLVLIVVKADIGRIDNVIDTVGKYAESFSSLFENIGVCVTHMDKVTWKQESFTTSLSDEFGIEKVVFSDLFGDGEDLIRDILAVCGKARPLDITCDNFLKYFKISKNNFKILKSVNTEVANFKVMKHEFEKALLKHTDDENISLICEFQEWMKDQITQAQTRVITENNFKFSDDEDFLYESGHITNLTNQLKLVLSDVKISAQRFRKSRARAEATPSKMNRDDGETNFGSEKTSNQTQLSNFTFHWLPQKLVILKRQKILVREKPLLNDQGKSVGNSHKPIIRNNDPMVNLPDKNYLFGNNARYHHKSVPKFTNTVNTKPIESKTGSKYANPIRVRDDSGFSVIKSGHYDGGILKPEHKNSLARLDRRPSTGSMVRKKQEKHNSNGKLKSRCSSCSQLYLG